MRRTLRGYEVHEAGSVREALDLLRGGGFDAIVSDYALDEDSNGLDLLQVVRVQYPTTIRFLVTATRDLDVAMRAVNEGAVDRYFLKPWNDAKLRDALEIVLHGRHTPSGPVGAA